MQKKAKTEIFWSQFLRAVETEPLELTQLRGLSGIDHPMLACGKDDARKRLVVISADANSRTAALAQSDLQAAFDSYKVLLCRPFWLDLGSDRGIPRHIKTALGDTALSNSIGRLELVMRKDMANLSPDDITRFVIELDLKLGNCPIYLDDFSARDVDTICASKGLEDAREVLKKLSLLEYFFPSPDGLALGLVDRARFNRSTLLKNLKATPALGHPYEVGSISHTRRISTIVDELHEKGLVVDGEISLETTEAGRSVRSSIRFKPKEGLVSKILNRISLSLSIKDLLGR